MGCASGTLTAYLATSGSVATGIDASEKMIQLANAKHPDLDFHVADAVELPFETGTFDAVIAASLLNIVSDQEKVMAELVRSCKKEGSISVLVPSAQFNDNDLRSLQASLGSSGFSAAAMKAWHKLPPKMAEDDIVSLFEQAGLTNITTEYYLHDMVVSVAGMKRF
ncbi:MAG: class I SAM-dependent methyltransferase [Gammaproteobacteria bacterium]|nr:class I SAM-dependent methyltransferase [Gammaproteobacteria bacterium]